jgi:non-ribosomal peptide synthetase component F
LSVLYAAFREGVASPLLELPLQYADYAVWQREWMQGKRSLAQLDYWKQQLRGADFRLPLRTDRPETQEPHFEGAMQVFVLDNCLADALKELARQERATLYMVLLAAFVVLLYADKRQEDICLGTPVSGRRWTETEGLLGLFLNTLVMRTQVSEEARFGEVLALVRAAVLEAHAHQDLPFEQVVDALKPRRDLSHTPLFRIWFVLHDEQAALPTFSDLQVQPMGDVMEPAKYALSLSFSHIGEGLRGSFAYQSHLFDGATISGLSAKLEVLCGLVAGDGQVRVSEMVSALEELERGMRMEQEQSLDAANRQQFRRVARTAVRQ